MSTIAEGWKQNKKTATYREKKKMVPVYILEVQFGLPVATGAVQKELWDYFFTQSEGGSGSGSESESESRGGGRAGQKRKKQEKQRVKRKYAYTVIWKQPEGAKARIICREEGIKARKYLDPKVEKADIGPTCFHNTVKEGRDREQEVSKNSRLLPIRTGILGYPAVRKMSKQKLQVVFEMYLRRRKVTGGGTNCKITIFISNLFTKYFHNFCSLCHGHMTGRLSRTLYLNLSS